MRITVNGEPRDVPEGTTALDLLRRLGVDLDGVAVERNRAIVARRDLEAVALAPGDRVEVVTFVGGG